MRKECETKKSCQSADSNYASDRTANMMYEMGLFRESIGLPPIPDSAPYRRPELKPMKQGQDYSVKSQ